MSGQLRSLKNRIRSVESTKKITRAMEMVSAAKLHRFQDIMAKGRFYADAMENLLSRLTAGLPEQMATHPLLAKREIKKQALVIFTSDTGLCGSFNQDTVQEVRRFVRESKIETLVIGSGKFGIHALKRFGIECRHGFTDLRGSRIEEIIQSLQKLLEEEYTAGNYDAVYATYHHFRSASSSQLVTEQILPLKTPEKKEEQTASSQYIFEPDRQTIFNRLVPLYFEAKIRQIFLENFVSEQIARMQAMHQATENAADMIKSLTLKRNKVRQAAITKEIIEIVTGSLALKK